MLLSWTGETTPDVDLETEIRAAHAAGFGGIEIFVPKLAPYLAKHTARDLGRALRDANLVPVSLNGLEHVNLRTRADFAQVKTECKQLASIAADCGCRDIVIVPDPCPQGMSDAEVVAQSADEVRELAEVAAPFGVTLAFEFLAPANCSVRTLALAHKIIERAATHPSTTRRPHPERNEVESKDGRRSAQDAIGIVFDTFHFFVGGSAMTEIAPAATRLIRLVHINDVESKPREAMTDADRLLPGEGVLPLDAMLCALKANGFDGAYSLEVMRPAYRAREIGEYMADARGKVERAVNKAK
ncbi:MAG: sugar phosphate isomerase/epimerase family protein [Chloroflexota bacterium]